MLSFYQVATRLLLQLIGTTCAFLCVYMGVPGGGRRGRQPPTPSLLGKQSQSGNIRFTVGQYWLIVKINGINSVNFVGNSVNFVGNMLSNRNFS